MLLCMCEMSRREFERRRERFLEWAPLLMLALYPFSQVPDLLSSHEMDTVNHIKLAGLFSIMHPGMLK